MKKLSSISLVDWNEILCCSPQVNFITYRVDVVSCIKVARSVMCRLFFATNMVLIL
jgi:hypothetical protein